MKDFIYKTAEEIPAMSAEEQNKYLADKKKHEEAEMKKEIEKSVKPLADAQSEAAKDIEAIKDELKFVGETIKTIFNGNVENDLKKALEANAEKIKEVYEAKAGVVEITFKAPEIITTQNGGDVAIPQAFATQLAPLQNVNLRRPLILDLVEEVATSQASYAYTEAIPKDGDYAFVAEGAVKPQIDFTWETNYAKPSKIAAWMKLTEEAVQDVKGLESVARDYLKKRHDLFKARAILNGTGTGEQPKGAFAYGRAFTADGLAAAITNPNFMDVVNAAIVDIATTHNYQDETPYIANVVLVNPVDFFVNMVAAKTAEGTPLYPTASIFNRVNIGGVTIVPDEMVPAGKIFVGDLSKMLVTNYMPYTVKIGWVNDDFIRNQFVILGESRFHVIVKKLDGLSAFIYDDIATIKTAITKP